MVLSRHNNQQIYDSIRKKWVEATPEEIVRQKLIACMTQNLGYPEDALAVEKSLAELTLVPVPNRRIDILCFNTKILKPLLLIECKAVPIQKKMFSQVLGYNAFIKAPFICIANQDSVFLGRNDQEIVQNGLPTYLDLLDAC